MPTSLDSIINTLMSYTYKDLEGVEGNEFSFHPTTPMVLDIAAIQYIYGANTSFHSGNDTYRYSDTGTYHEALWDAGGIDAILYSGAAPTFVNLNPIHGSFIGQPVFVQSNGVNVGKPVPNMWIAKGTIIENAITGTGNDILIGNGIANLLDGNLGIDTVLISANLAQYAVNKAANQSYDVIENSNTSNQDQLNNIERLVFNDAKLALDLDGHAGRVAKLLGAVFGASFVSNQEYVGIGLIEADRLEYQQLADYALSARGFTNHDKLVTTLWANLFGNVPSEIEKAPYIKMLDNGEISTGSLTIIAAESTANLQNINLIGLTESGIAYI